LEEVHVECVIGDSEVMLVTASKVEFFGSSMARSPREETRRKSASWRAFFELRRHSPSSESVGGEFGLSFVHSVALLPLVHHTPQHDLVKSTSALA
jgi:hypothetical protein